MKGALALRHAVPTAAALDTSGANITNSAYVQLVASTANACSGLGLTNQGAQPLIVAVGGAGSEVDTGIIIPPAQSVIFPHNIAKGKRISLKSAGGTQSTGWVTISLFQ